MIPGALVCSAIGFGGQKLVNRLAERDVDDASNIAESPSIMERILASKWLPMKRLSDEEYRDILRNKLVRVESDISLLDEDINQSKLEGPHSESNG